MKSDLYAKIYQVVRGIPRGRVATYGQVAALAGYPRHARVVGYALSALSDDHGDAAEVPWQRVVNAAGRVSPRSHPGWGGLQEHLLRDEGIEIRLDGSLDLEHYRWRPSAKSISRFSAKKADTS